ncbi:MAG: hypothetical protein ABL894_00575 [Hyphomicrobium sp.]
MAVLRFMSALFFLIALIALAADATPLLSGPAGFHPASVQQRWSEIAPAALSAAQQSFADRGISALWNILLMPVLSLPACVVFGVLGALMGYAGRRRRRINVFVN